MPRNPMSQPGTRQYGTKTRYTEQALQEAIMKIRTCKLSQRQASKLYNIPRSTLNNKLAKKHCKTVGRPCVFDEEEEITLTQHIEVLSDLGIPVTMSDVRYILKSYLDNANRNIPYFKFNLPGWDWGNAFLARHPQLKQKIGHNICRKRAQVNEEIINKFFNHLEKELEGISAGNIYNFDETGFHDVPKKSKLLFRRNCRNPEIILNATKSCYTVMYCGNAAGEMIPPFFIYKAKLKWSDWMQGAPAGSRMAVTKSGWIDCDIFEEWFERHLLPFLKKKEGGKAVIGDNLSSHISTKVLRLCSENNIKFICLPPNATHLLQPLDVAFFSALKTNWRQVLSEWRQTSRGKVAGALPKHIFASLVKRTMDLATPNIASNIKAGFKASGICPLNRQNIIQKLPSYSKENIDMNSSIGESFKTYLEETRRDDLTPKTKQRKFQIPIVAGKSVSAEEVEKFYEEKESRISSRGSKRGRPPGRKIAKKKNHASDKPEPCSSTNVITISKPTIDGKALESSEQSSSQTMTAQPISEQPSQQLISQEPNKDTSSSEPILPESASSECGIVIEDCVVGADGAIVSDCQGQTRTICFRDFCIVNYEGTMFPGQIMNIENDLCTLNVFQKGMDGWLIPRTPDKLNIHITHIIKKLEDYQITKSIDGAYLFNDDLLYMEWGD